MWILCVQQQQLSADGIGVFVFDLRAKEDDAVLEEGLVDVVVKSKAVAVAGVVVSGTYCPGLIGGAEEFRSGSGVHVDEPTPERLGSRAEISSVRCGRRRVKITDAMESSARILRWFGRLLIIVGNVILGRFGFRLGVAAVFVEVRQRHDRAVGIGDSC
jgi:hypothetical protein